MRQVWQVCFGRLQDGDVTVEGKALWTRHCPCDMFVQIRFYCGLRLRWSFPDLVTRKLALSDPEEKTLS